MSAIFGSEVDDAQRVRSSGRDPARFKVASCEYSSAKHFAFIYKKSDKVKVRAKCATLSCEWEILASKHEKDNSFIVKTYLGTHNCLSTNKNKQVIAKVVATNLKDDIIKMPFLRASFLKGLVKGQLLVVVGRDGNN
ncbi:Transposase [Theobroma cacao]|nr:Transposase [Theobroma cacao]